MEPESDRHQHFVLLTFGMVSIVLVGLALIIDKGADVIIINGRHSSFGDFFFPKVTHLGDGIVFVPIVIALMFFSLRYFAIALVSSLLHGLIVNILKYYVFDQMARPMTILDPEALHFVPGVPVHEYNSFPSGHTTTAFCAAMVLALVVRRRWIGLTCLVLAILVGYSRVYLLQHFLMDVAAGSVIGCTVAWLSWTWLHRAKRSWMTKRLNSSFKLVNAQPAY